MYTDGTGVSFAGCQDSTELHNEALYNPSANCGEKVLVRSLSCSLVWVRTGV